MMNRYLLTLSPLVGMIGLMTIAQLLFKQAGLYATSHSEWYWALVLNPWLGIGLAASGAGMGCWLLTLRRLPLSSAYPWTAVIYVITPLAGALLFDEAISSRYAFGMVLIVVGVVLASRSVKR